MDTDLEYILAAANNLLFIGEHMLKDPNPDHWLYYIQHEAVPVARGIQAAVRRIEGSHQP